MIHVLIERHVADGGVSTYEALSQKTLQQNYACEGFISAESFANTNDVHHRFLLSKWRTQRDWNRWYHSEERLALMNHILPLLTHGEKILLLEH